MREGWGGRRRGRQEGGWGKTGQEDEEEEEEEEEEDEELNVAAPRLANICTPRANYRVFRVIGGWSEPESEKKEKRCFHFCFIFCWTPGPRENGNHSVENERKTVKEKRKKNEKTTAQQIIEKTTNSLNNRKNINRNRTNQ